MALEKKKWSPIRFNIPCDTRKREIKITRTRSDEKSNELHKLIHASNKISIANSFNHE